MTTHDLLEFAVWLARPHHVQGVAPTGWALHFFRESSHRLCRRWDQRFRLADWTPETARAAYEVFTADVVVRVWSAVITSRDRLFNEVYAEPFARQAVLGQLRMRRMVLERMLSAGAAHHDVVQGLNEFRRNSERWTDLILGRWVARYELDDFAVDAARARDLSNGADKGRFSWDEMRSSLKNAFPLWAPSNFPCEEHLLELLRSVVVALPAAVLQPDILPLFDQLEPFIAEEPQTRRRTTGEPAAVLSYASLRRSSPSEPGT